MNKRLNKVFMSAVLATGLSACSTYQSGEPVRIDSDITLRDSNRVIQDFNRAERARTGGANDNDPSVINVTINSRGGNVRDGFRIINEIQNSQSQVHLKCEGQASSMAAIILITATGQNRDAEEDCTIMIHQSYYKVRDPNNPRLNIARTLYEALLPQYQIARNDPNIRKVVIQQPGEPPYELSRGRLIKWVEQLAQDRKIFKERLAATTHLNIYDIEKLLRNGDNYFSAEEAVFAGMIDTIDGRDPNRSQIKQGQRSFCNIYRDLSLCS